LRGIDGERFLDVGERTVLIFGLLSTMIDSGLKEEGGFIFLEIDIFGGVVIVI